MELWEKLLLQSVGPLVTAVVGTLIIGTFVSWITRKVQERRAENQLRIQLIDQMTEAASSLYMTTQNYWRKKTFEKVDKKKLTQYREELDKQYRASRVTGEVIERRLEAYFMSNEPKALWHATMDLLTVRYFHLIGLTTENLLKLNSGVEHTGLSVDELRNQTTILDTYRANLKKVAQAVLEGPIRPLAI